MYILDSSRAPPARSILSRALKRALATGLFQPEPSKIISEASWPRSAKCHFAVKTKITNADRQLWMSERSGVLNPSIRTNNFEDQAFLDLMPATV